MSSVLELQATTPQNLRSLRKLSRIITLSQGQFSLVLACCNQPQLARYMTQAARKANPISIEELVVPPSSQTLYTIIRDRLPGKHPQALMVFGLDSVTAIDSVLGSANMMRNEFAKQFPFPTILWMNDRTLVKLRRVAPDLRNCAANPIRFEAEPLEIESAKSLASSASGTIEDGY